MLRRLCAPLVGSAGKTLRVPSLLPRSSGRWNSSGPRDTAEEDADDDAIFDEDFEFLDELLGEGGADVFDFIPDNDIGLLNHENR
ncbi:hypothetical protein ERJ75_000220000 [Trypanosoma vivax]|nr:hypothetical protein ERJ75_000220000 [Trypanosoma vivax]